MPAVPNQRTLTINKEPTDKQHKFTANNLEALDEAAGRLQSKAGFKLYMYLAKNQNKYSFALSSADFCTWSGVGLTAYRTAFEELEQQGYLISKETGENEKKLTYTFYDKAQKDNIKADKDTINIEIPTEQVQEIRSTEEEFKRQFGYN